MFVSFHLRLCEHSKAECADKPWSSVRTCCRNCWAASRAWSGKLEGASYVLRYVQYVHTQSRWRGELLAHHQLGPTRPYVRYPNRSCLRRRATTAAKDLYPDLGAYKPGLIIVVDDLLALSQHNQTNNLPSFRCQYHRGQKTNNSKTKPVLK